MRSSVPPSPAPDSRTSRRISPAARRAGYRFAAGSLALACILPSTIVPSSAAGPYTSIASLPADCQAPADSPDPTLFSTHASGAFSHGDTTCTFAAAVIDKSQPNWTNTGFTYGITPDDSENMLQIQHFGGPSDTSFRIPLAVYREVRDAQLTVTLPAGSDSPSTSTTPRLFIANESAIVAEHYSRALTPTSSPAVPTPVRTVNPNGTITYTYSFPVIPAESRMMLSFQGHGYVAGTQAYASALLYGTRVHPKVDYAPGLGTDADPYIYRLRDLNPGETVTVRVPIPADQAVSGTDSSYTVQAVAGADGTAELPLTWAAAIPGTVLQPQVGFPKLSSSATGQLVTVPFVDDELSTLQIETPSWEHTTTGAGTEDSPWVNTYSGLIPGDTVEATVTVPAADSTDGQEHTYTSTAVADADGVAVVPVTWGSALGGRSLPLSVSVAHDPAGADVDGDGTAETPARTAATPVSAFDSEVRTADSRTVSTGSGLGTAESPWTIEYTGLAPGAEYTVTLVLPDGTRLDPITLTAGADGTATADVIWPADAVPPGTRLTAELQQDGSTVPGLEQLLTTPTTQISSPGTGTAQDPLTQLLTGLSPGAIVVVTVTVPADRSDDGQEHTYPHTGTVAGDGTLTIPLTWDHASEGAELPLTVTVDGFDAPSLATTTTAPSSRTVSTGDGQGTAESPWSLDYLNLRPSTEHTVVVRGPDGQLSTRTFTTDADGHGSVSVEWPAGVPAGTLLTASVLDSDGAAVTGLDQTQTTPTATTTSSGREQGSAETPWTIDYTDLAPGTEYTVAVTGPDGAVTETAFTTDAAGRGTAELSWPDGSVPAASDLTAAISRDGVVLETLEQTLRTPAEATADTVSTGDGQGTAESPWTIRYDLLAPDTEYTVTVAGPDGAVSDATFTSDADGRAVVDLVWPQGSVPPDTALTATVTAADGTPVIGTDEIQRTPAAETTSSGYDHGSEANPWTVDYTGLSPDTEYTVAVTGPDGQVTETTFTADGEGRGTAALSWPADAVAPGTELTAAISRDGTALSTLEQSLTTAQAPTATTTSSGYGQGTAANPWQIAYTGLAPGTEYTVAVNGPDGQVIEVPFTTDDDGSGIAELVWPAGSVPPSTELTAVISRDGSALPDLDQALTTSPAPTSGSISTGDGQGRIVSPWTVEYRDLAPSTEYIATVTGPDGEISSIRFTTDPDGYSLVDLTWASGAVPQGTAITVDLTQTDGTAIEGVQLQQTTPSAATVSTGSDQGTAANPWQIDYSDLDPDSEYTVAVAGPDGEIEKITFTTDADGNGTAELSWPAGAVPAGTEVSALITHNGAILHTLTQTLTTAQEAAAPTSETTSTGDDQGSTGNPWTIDYTGLTPDTEHTVVVTGPDGELTEVTFTTDADGNGTASITWPAGSVPGGTEVTATILGPDGEPITALDESITTGPEAPEPTPEPTATPTPEPTATPTPEPTATPTAEPTPEPTVDPTPEPTPEPTATPTPEPTPEPTATPTEEPTPEPTVDPTAEPTATPTAEPTAEPTEEPTQAPPRTRRRSPPRRAMTRAAPRTPGRSSTSTSARTPSTR